MLVFPAMHLDAFLPPASPRFWLQWERGRYDATSGGSLVTSDSGQIARWEDRTANASHFTQATSAEQLIYDATRGYVSATIPNNHYLDPPASFTFDRRAFSLFLICSLTNLRRGWPGSLASNHIIARSASDTCNFYYVGTGSDADAWKLTAFNSTEKHTPTIPYTTDLTLIGFVGSASEFRTWSRLESNAIAALTSGTSTLDSLLGSTSAAQPLQANIRDILFYDRALTSDEITKTLWRYAVSRGVPASQLNQILFVGDSMTHGIGQTKNQNWPSRLTGLGSVYKRVTAEASITLQTLNGQTAREISLFRSGETNVAVIFGGTNDIALGAATGATTYSRLETERAALAGAGFKTIAVKMVDRGDFTGTMDGYRSDFNASIDTNSGDFDAVFDPMAHDSDFNNAASSKFAADNIHFSDSGAASFAAGIQSVIAGEL